MGGVFVYESQVSEEFFSKYSMMPKTKKVPTTKPMNTGHAIAVTASTSKPIAPNTKNPTTDPSKAMAPFRILILRLA